MPDSLIRIPSCPGNGPQCIDDGLRIRCAHPQIVFNRQIGTFQWLEEIRVAALCIRMPVECVEFLRHPGIETFLSRRSRHEPTLLLATPSCTRKGFAEPAHEIAVIRKGRISPCPFA